MAAHFADLFKRKFLHRAEVGKPQPSTPVFMGADPKLWREHRFGLSLERWNFLKDKAVWITGSGTGFGQAMAVGLAAAGARVILSGRKREKLENTVALMESFGIPSARILILPFDLLEYSEIERACEQVRQKFGGLFGLINNAAVAPQGDALPLLKDPIEAWEKMVRLNVSAPWYLTRMALPLMAKGGAGRVLFVSSEAGWSFSSGHGHYNVSKSALNNLSASFAEESSRAFPEADLQMNTLVPGEARTEMNQGSTTSPFTVVSMALTLLSQPRGGPTGHFFHRDGRHLRFGYQNEFGMSLN